VQPRAAPACTTGAAQSLVTTAVPYRTEMPTPTRNTVMFASARFG